MKRLRIASALTGVASTLMLGLAQAAGTIALPQTDQTTCYHPVDPVEIPCAGSGQDGETRAGVAWPEPRFTDHGDGTITDNLTGLMWFKNPACFGSTDWGAALDKIADLNARPENYGCNGYYTAQYGDWVLPNINELKTMTPSREHGWHSLQDAGFVFSEWPFWSSTSARYHSPDTAWISTLDPRGKWPLGLASEYGYPLKNTANSIGEWNKSSSIYSGGVWPVRVGQ